MGDTLSSKQKRIAQDLMRDTVDSSRRVKRGADLSVISPSPINKRFDNRSPS